MYVGVSVCQSNGVNMCIYCNIRYAFCIVSSVSEDTLLHYTVHVGVCTCFRLPCTMEGRLC